MVSFFIKRLFRNSITPTSMQKCFWVKYTWSKFILSVQIVLPSSYLAFAAYDVTIAVLLSNWLNNEQKGFEIKTFPTAFVIEANQREEENVKKASTFPCKLFRYCGLEISKFVSDNHFFGGRLRESNEACKLLDKLNWMKHAERFLKYLKNAKISMRAVK